MIAADFVIKHRDDDDISPYLEEGLRSILHLILIKDQEAEQMALIVVPKSLGIQVRQYHNFGGVKMEPFPFEVPEDAVRLNIVVKTKGHYDMLYAATEADLDGYDFDDGFYNILLNKS